MMLVSLLVSLGAVVGVAGLECRPNGPIFPRPDLSRSKTFKAAAAELSSVLNKAINGTIRAGWDLSKTSFSVGLVSRFQEQPAVPVWEYHHLAEDTILGTDDLTRNSQYQIGSISKAITDAVLIRSGLNLDDPITKWLPGLGGSPSLIRWESITLRQLASHLAGIPPNREFWIP
jgi:CubicO group peptidase (beta-lactamase class C family)